jgi:L-alanine-DL-glutamate epimerase-like enolase superfamily enzyme
MLSRRQFMATAGSIAATGFIPERSHVLRAMPGAESELGKVKITSVKTARVHLTRYDVPFVKIETDAGLYGIGEAYHKGPGAVLEHVHDIKRQVIGEDPLQVDYLFQKMLERGSGMDGLTGAMTGAIAGIETALWDLAGKILNVPVFVLLGGKFRDKLLVYHDTGAVRTTDTSEWIDQAQRSLDLGFKAIKFDLYRFEGEHWNRSLSQKDLNRWVRIMEALREKLGPEFPLSVDLHWKFNTRDVLRFLDAVEHLNLWYLEDPVPWLNADAMKRVTDASNVPILTGENLYTRPMWQPFIEKQACDIIQPDTQRCGGLLELKKIADWADLYYMPMSCHNGCSPLGAYASAHACASIRSFLALESDSVEIPHWQDLILRDGPVYVDGYVEVPNKPGIGVELNEDVCRANLADGSGYFK